MVTEKEEVVAENMEEEEETMELTETQVLMG